MAVCAGGPVPRLCELRPLRPLLAKYYTSPAGLTSLVVMLAPIPQLLILATISSPPALERSSWPAQTWKRQNQIMSFWSPKIKLWVYYIIMYVYEWYTFTWMYFIRVYLYLDFSSISNGKVSGKSIFWFSLTITHSGNGPATQILFLSNTEAMGVSFRWLTHMLIKWYWMYYIWKERVLHITILNC